MHPTLATAHGSDTAQLLSDSGFFDSRTPVDPADRGDHADSFASRRVEHIEAAHWRIQAGRLIAAIALLAAERGDRDAGDADDREIGAILGRLATGTCAIGDLRAEALTLHYQQEIIDRLTSLVGMVTTEWRIVAHAASGAMTNPRRRFRTPAHLRCHGFA